PSLPPPSPPHSVSLTLHDALPTFPPAPPRHHIDGHTLGQGRDDRASATVPLPRLRGTGGADRHADVLPHRLDDRGDVRVELDIGDRKSTRLNSSHVSTSYAASCLK